MAITCLASWYGSNRMLAQHAGRLLKGCSWVGLPFAGGMSELAHITARTVVVSDLHRHVINLAMCVAHSEKKARMVEFLDGLPFHPDTLAAAQTHCREREESPAAGDWVWAANYFVCVWMARNGTAGTDTEFDAGLSVRWNAGGGDSVVRFRNATAALADWHKIMARCTFVPLDVFDFLDKVKDEQKSGLYLDAPWPDDGGRYKHKFGPEQQVRLADRLAGFQRARVVVRYGDHELIRKLYPAGAWTWHELTGRTAANKAKAEVLIVRNGA
jgi:DNA adenine methylase